MDQRTYEILSIRTESPKVKTFFFNFEKPMPGQFLMVWVPGAEEIPISASYFNGKKIGISVAAVGRTSKKLHTFKAGQFVGLRGPYGNFFKLKGKKILLICGGYGAAPLVYFAEFSKKAKKGLEITTLLGAKNKEELLFLERFKKVSRLFCATNNGSFGHKGFVTELLEEKLDKEKFDCVYACGPELMLKAALDICLKYKTDFQASLERWIKCGLGLCGSCIIGPGIRVCQDGPVFSSEQLKTFSDFGKFKLSPSGLKVPI